MTSWRLYFTDACHGHPARSTTPNCEHHTTASCLLSQNIGLSRRRRSSHLCRVPRRPGNRGRELRNRHPQEENVLQVGSRTRPGDPKSGDIRDNIQGGGDRHANEIMKNACNACRTTSMRTKPPMTLVDISRHCFGAKKVLWPTAVKEWGL